MQQRTDFEEKEEEEKNLQDRDCILALLESLLAVAAVNYGIYRFFTPDYLDDFEDDFEDDFDDDFFEDDQV